MIWAVGGSLAMTLNTSPCSQGRFAVAAGIYYFAVLCICVAVHLGSIFLGETALNPDGQVSDSACQEGLELTINRNKKC